MSLFRSFFTTLVGQQVTVELKNDLAINGTLHSVDQARASRNALRARSAAALPALGGAAADAHTTLRWARAKARPAAARAASRSSAVPQHQAGEH